MPTLEAVTPANHTGQYWHPSSNYQFARQDTLARLAVAEIPDACLSVPVGFTWISEEFVPVALQGLRARQNLCVDGKGHWRTEYVPAVYRARPFSIAHSGQRRILCVDRDSGLVDEDDSGRPFFDAEGQPSDATRRMIAFLKRLHASHDITQSRCKQLNRLGLIQPWPLKVGGNDNTQTLKGLYRIDESALNALSGSDFEQLRQAGALPMIYCQLLSMRQTSRLARLARLHYEQSSAGSPDDTLDLEFLKHNGTRRFN